MGLVGRVGRRRVRAKFAMLVVYVLLALGAVTTLYPFLLMVSTGFKGPTDQNDNKLVPTYFQEDPVVLEKYLDDKYAGDKSMIASTRIGGDAEPEEVADYRRFLEQLPVEYWSPAFRTAAGQVTGRLAREYLSWLKKRYRTIDDLNRAYIEENVAFQTVVPPNELLERANWQPKATPKYTEWLEFKATLPAEFRIPVRAQRMFQEWMRSKTQNTFDSVPPEIKGQATVFEELAWPADLQVAPSLYGEFLTTAIPARYRAKTTEELWKEWSKSDRPMPIAAYESDHVRQNLGSIRQEFAGRNYAYVTDYILINGRALWNTALFCILLIVTQLTVNPLAAYALSRYPIRQSGQILLFLLATMAFPAEVAMIPSFLLLKDLGLLNTFAALVLPTAASGYMIFLLKGFFDSLPSELFEAGQLDGAKETTMMTRIAFPLSRPVLGYLALLAFMAAYGTFMYAFLVVQDQRMWTLMVWIYSLQGVAPKAVKIGRASYRERV